MSNLLVNRRLLHSSQISGGSFTAMGQVKQFVKMYKKQTYLVHHIVDEDTVKLDTPGITTKQMMALGGWESPII